MKPRFLIAAVLAGLVAASSAHAATTTVSPSAGRAGSEVAVWGAGFPAGRPAVVTLGGRQVASAPVNAAGRFTASFEIPNGLAPGPKRLVARAGTTSVVNVVRVGAAVSAVARAAATTGQHVVAPAAPSAGQRIRVSGGGFRALRAVRVYLNGSLRANTRTNRAGAFLARVLVPAGARSDATLAVVSSGRVLQLPVFVQSASVPQAFSFGRTAGGVRTGDGFGTGFRGVLRYLPQNLDVNAAAGVLNVTTTSTDFFGTADQQDNALYVTTDGLNRKLEISTAVKTAANATQYPAQAGLWFGTSADNYVKLVVLSRPSAGGLIVELKWEQNGMGGTGVQSVLVGAPGTTVTLVLHTNPNGTVTGTYQGSARSGSLTLTDVPTSHFSASDQVGILATHAGTSTPLVYGFESFRVVSAGPAIPPPPTTGIGTWTQRADMPQPVLDAAGATIGDKLYAVGGKWGGSHRRSLYVYDASANSWSSGAELPEAYAGVGNPGVEDIAAVATGGNLYAFGGATAPFSGAVTSAAVYDPGSNAWTMLAPMPTPRSGATAEAVGGKIYVIGGMDATGTSLASVDVYDIASGTWSTAAPMKTRRDNPASAVAGGKIYVFGGRSRGGGVPERPTLSTVESYDPETNTWSTMASMPSGGRRSMAVGTICGRIQVIGGESNATTFATNEEYNPATNTWRALRPMPNARHGSAFGTIGSQVYVAGGALLRGSGSPTKLNQAYTRPCTS